MKATKSIRKILMTADTVGGVWTYALELIRSLEPHGIEVALATMGAPLSQNQQQQVKQLRNVTVYESSFKLEWMDNPWADVQAAGEWLLKLKEEVQPDLVHLNNLVHGHLNWGVPVMVVVHSCVLSWWQAVKGSCAPASWTRYREEVTQSLQAAALVVAPTAAMLEEATRLYGPFRSQKVISNGRTQAQFLAGKKEPVIFSMGRIWDEAKNIALLTSVAHLLPWPVYVAGDNTHPETGQSLDLPNVHFLGKLTEDEVAAWLSKSTIYVMPAKYEPFGLSVLEAALAGCAPVLGDIPSLGEVWSSSALYVSPTDSEELVTRLKLLIEDKELRQELAWKAWHRAQRFCPALMAGQYLKAYKELLQQKSPVPLQPETGLALAVA